MLAPVRQSRRIAGPDAGGGGKGGAPSRPGSAASGQADSSLLVLPLSLSSYLRSCCATCFAKLKKKTAGRLLNRVFASLVYQIRDIDRLVCRVGLIAQCCVADVTTPFRHRACRRWRPRRWRRPPSSCLRCAPQPASLASRSPLQGGRRWRWRSGPLPLARRRRLKVMVELGRTGPRPKTQLSFCC